MWLRRVASRRSTSTSAVTMSRTRSAPDVDAHPMRARQTGTDPDHAFDDRRRAARFADEPPGVGDLAAGLEVERRSRERHEAGLPRAERVNRLASARRTARRPARRRRASSCIPRTGRRGLERRLVAEREVGCRRGWPPNALLPARLVALRLHRQVEAGAVDAHVVRGGGVFDEVVGDAERVVEPERHVARQHALGPFRAPSRSPLRGAAGRRSARRRSGAPRRGSSSRSSRGCAPISG